jgi:hypothetical protein
VVTSGFFSYEHLVTCFPALEFLDARDLAGDYIPPGLHPRRLAISCRGPTLDSLTDLPAIEYLEIHLVHTEWPVLKTIAWPRTLRRIDIYDRWSRQTADINRLDAGPGVECRLTETVVVNRSVALQTWAASVCAALAMPGLPLPALNVPLESRAAHGRASS